MFVRRQPTSLMRSTPIAAFLASLLVPFVGAQQGAPAHRSAAVLEARVIYEGVERALRQHQLTQHDTTVECQEGLDARAQLHRDSNGRIRRINLDGGSGDHGESVATYFDTAGRPRFAFVQRGSVNGTQQEERVYLDARGAVV